VAASVALGVVLLAGLLLRLDNIAHGLPFVYHADEAQHFTSRAVAMFGGDLDPHYFQNPSAFTYLLHGVLRLTGGDVAAAYASDPTDASSPPCCACSAPRASSPWGGASGARAPG
jgi:hypothetical protein